MTAATVLARRLAAATDSRTATEPLTNGVDLDLDTAYLVQDELLSIRIGAGEVVTAAKLGLTSVAKQRQMNVDEPLYGWLTDGMALDRGQVLDVPRYIQPRVEPEIAFLIGTELAGPGVTAAGVLAATTAVMCAVDVLDSRYAGYRFTLPDVVADDASAAGYLLGDPRPVDGIDLRRLGCVFSKNGEVVATAAGAAVLGHPAAAVAWFVRKLAERNRSLRAGTVVLAGALTAAVPVAPGDSVRVEIDRLGSLELACR